jgi:tRNA (guanine37-N1)-methyltransferase
MMLSGDSRTASYEIPTGTSMIARYQEFGFQYRFNLSRIFFNVYLAYERMRVADQVEPGERFLVPFYGVGPFAIPAAAKGAEVFSIENNPDAYH